MEQTIRAFFGFTFLLDKSSENRLISFDIPFYEPHDKALINGVFINNDNRVYCSMSSIDGTDAHNMPFYHLDYPLRKAIRDLILHKLNVMLKQS